MTNVALICFDVYLVNDKNAHNTSFLQTGNFSINFKKREASARVPMYIGFVLVKLSVS